MTDPINPTATQRISTNPFDLLEAQENQENKNSGSNTSKEVQHDPPPTGNSKGEAIFDGLYEKAVQQKLAKQTSQTTSGQEVSKSDKSETPKISETQGDDLAVVYDAETLKELQILRNKRPDTRNFFARLWDGLFGRSLTEKQLTGFAFTNKDPVVLDLLNGKLNQYETQRVLDRIRYAHVYGGSADKYQTEQILSRVLDIVDEGTSLSFFRFRSPFYKAAKKIQKYYDEVATDFADRKSKVPHDYIKLQAQLSIYDRVILFNCSMQSRTIMRVNFTTVDCEKFSLALRSGKVLSDMEDEEKIRKESVTRRLRNNIDDKILCDWNGSISSKKIPLDEQSVGTFAEGFDMKRGLDTLANLLNALNEKLCENPGESEYTRLFDILRENESTRDAVARYCKLRFEETVSGSKSYAEPDYKESVQLKRVLCSPMLRMLLSKYASPDTVGSLGAFVESRCGTESSDYFWQAVNVAQQDWKS